MAWLCYRKYSFVVHFAKLLLSRHFEVFTAVGKGWSEEMRGSQWLNLVTTHATADGSAVSTIITDLNKVAGCNWKNATK